MRKVKLYIKTHNRTGLKYFGRHIGNNPDKYRGSGTDWVNHIAEHGNDVSTEIYAEFNEDDPKLRETALEFSHREDIAGSYKWLNRVPEDGESHGSPRGFVTCYDVELKKHIKVKKEAFDTDTKLVGNGTGFVSAINNKTGKSVKIPVSEFNHRDYKTSTTGLVSVVNLETFETEMISSKEFKKYNGVKFKRPTKGRVWVNNTLVNKLVQKDDVSKYLELGWILGMKYKKRKKNESK